MHSMYLIQNVNPFETERKAKGVGLHESSWNYKHIRLSDHLSSRGDLCWLYMDVDLDDGCITYSSWISEEDAIRLFVNKNNALIKL